MIAVIVVFAFTMSLLISMAEKMIMHSEDALKTIEENEEKLLPEKAE